MLFRRACQQPVYTLSKEEHLECRLFVSYLAPLVFGFVVALLAYVKTSEWSFPLRSGLSILLFLSLFLSLKWLIQRSSLHDWYYYHDYAERLRKQGVDEQEVQSKMEEEHVRRRSQSRVHRPSYDRGWRVNVNL